jgi:hypothetical protein
MTNKFMDMEHEALLRYVNRLNEDVDGIQRIINIFMKLKNEVMYDSIKKSEQLASETLVMGCGNNFNKNNLLCTVLQLTGYECELQYKNVTDNTKWLFSRNGKAIPWYYVHVDYLGKVLNLDCSFDRNFMNAARIVNKGDKLTYELENYYFVDGRVFEVLNDPFKHEVKTTKPEGYVLGRGKLCI